MTHTPELDKEIEAIRELGREHRLREAAPKMLAALKRIANPRGRECVMASPAIMDEIRAAIAEAEGKS